MKFLDKRIPTLIGVLILIGGVVAGIYVVGQSTDFLPRANPEQTPKKVKITNISENGFVVSWITQAPTSGYIKLGTQPDSLEETYEDERDQLTGETGQFRAHYISVRGLEPDTQYVFKLGSGGNYLYDNEGDAFSVTTAPLLSSPPVADTAYGKVLTPAETPADDTIVYLTFADATPMSALVKNEGNWAISLSSARNQKLDQYVNYDPQTTPLNIFVQSGRDETSQVTTTADNDQPAPDIVLGSDQIQSLDQANQATTTPSPIPENSFSLDPLDDVEPKINETNATVNITSIPEEGTEFQTQSPTFSGTAPPGRTIQITIESSHAIELEVMSDTSGVWQVVTPGTLEPGTHSITASYTDDNGTPHQVTRQFTVLAAATSNNSPQNTATPSATIAPTPTITPQPTSPPRVSYPATESGIPTAGETTNTLVLLLGGGISMLAGVWLLSNKRWR